MGFQDGSVIKNPPASAADTGLIPGSRRSPGEGNGNPLQYSFLENPMGRGAWRVTVHGVARVRHDLVTRLPPYYICRFPGGSVVKNLPTNAGDVVSILGLGRSPEEGNGNPL